MNYTTLISKIREFFAIPQQLAGIHQSIEKQGEATRAAYEGKQQQDQEQYRKVEVRFDDQEIRKREREQENQTGIQKSIKRAQWFTFWAATLYAGITVLLWLNARNQLEMEQRASLQSVRFRFAVHSNLKANAGRFCG